MSSDSKDIKTILKLSFCSLLHTEQPFKKPHVSSRINNTHGPEQQIDTCQPPAAGSQAQNSAAPTNYF